MNIWTTPIHYLTMARNEPAYPLRFPSVEYRDRLKQEAGANGQSLQEYLIHLVDSHPDRKHDLTEMFNHGRTAMLFQSRSLEDIVRREINEDGSIKWTCFKGDAPNNKVDPIAARYMEEEYQRRFPSKTP